MTEQLANFVGGRWVQGADPTIVIRDPVLNCDLARASSLGLDLRKAFGYARGKGGEAIRDLTYAQRAKALGACVAILKQHRERYLTMSMDNSGTTTADSMIDVDGAIFTLNYFAKIGETLGAARFLRDRDLTDLSRDASFQVQHLLVPRRGVALLINAFNFPAWGLWEKAAPALLSGMPVIVKPATPTAWVAHAMVKDVVTAGVLPVGALSIVCGSSDGLLDALEPFDVLSFTGSAATALKLRSHTAVAARSVRANIESDSVNSAILAMSTSAASPSFQLFVKEVVREMISKSGQKCTAIRRAFVPRDLLEVTAQAIAAVLSEIKVGNPRNPTVKMGSLVSHQQRLEVERGIASLREVTTTIVDGSRHELIDVSADAAIVSPWLFKVTGPVPDLVNTTEVFGPVATLIGYQDLEEACMHIARGEGSLVASVFGDDPQENASLAQRIAPFHGRVHVVSPAVAKSQTGHGNAMPMSTHGGPGRAGGGSELGGLRSLEFYHQRCAIQAETASLEALQVATHWTY